MKIAVTAQSHDAEGAMDGRFGRARCFAVLDDASDAWTFVDNTQNLNAAQGAGTQSARAVSETDAEVVITGNVGPKAFATLRAAGVRVYLCDAATVREAVEAFKTGKLTETDDSNVEGHWV